jgi:hypothetical protein
VRNVYTQTPWGVPKTLPWRLPELIDSMASTLALPSARKPLDLECRTENLDPVSGLPTMRRSNAHYGRPDPGVMLLCCAPLPQQSYRSPLTVTAKQQRISQGGAFDDLTRSFIVSGNLRSNTEICTAINQ